MIEPILQKKLDISEFSGTSKIFQMYFIIIIGMFAVCIFIDKIRNLLFKLINKCFLIKFISRRIDKLNLKIDSKVN